MTQLKHNLLTVLFKSHVRFTVVPSLIWSVAPNVTPLIRSVAPKVTPLIRSVAPKVTPLIRTDFRCTMIV